MAMCTETGLSPSYAYKRGCRCPVCKALKAEYTRREGPAARARVRAWHKNHPDAMRGYRKRSADKRWLAAYGKLQAEQGGKCAICGAGVQGMTASKTRLSVDHCHASGKIRGLLCGGCNVGLGHFKDSVALLSSAIDYLKRTGSGA